MGEDDSLTEVDKVLAKQGEQIKAQEALTMAYKRQGQIQKEFNNHAKKLAQLQGLKRKFGIAKDPEAKKALQALIDQVKQLKKELRDAGAKDMKKAIKDAGGQAKGHHWMQGLKTSMANAFAPLTKAFRPLTKGISAIGNRVGAGLKKSGMMPMLGMAGAGILGGVIGKVVSSSPLLQSMMKMMNMAMTLIFRPIGDFIGSIMRPLMISFIKDIAVPFFKASKGMMKQGEAIGKGLLGVFTDPIKSIHSAIVLGLNSILPAWMLGGDDVIKEAKAFQANPTAFARRGAGVGEFSRSKNFSIVPTDAELLDAGYTDDEIGAMDEYRTGYSWRKVMKAREDDMIPEGGERIWGATSTSVGKEKTFGTTAEATIFSKEWWDSILNPIPEAAGDAGDTIDDGSDKIEDSTNRFSDMIDTATGDIQKDWDLQQEVLYGATNTWKDFAIDSSGFTKSISDGFSTWGTGLHTSWDTWATQLAADYNNWAESVGLAKDEWGESTLEWLGLSDQENKEKKKTIDQTKDTDESWLDSLWGMVTNWNLGSMEIKQAFAETAGTINNANKVIEEKAIQINTGAIATQGGLLTGTSTQDALASLGSSGGSVAYGGAFTPYGQFAGGNFNVSGFDASSIENISKDHLGYLEGKNITNVSTAIMSTEQARAEALKVTGGSVLGDAAGNKFEASPGVFVDISFRGQKVDPTSAEGKRIQAQYQKQLENRIQNEAQTNFFNKVGDLSREGAKAYVLAGGGEAGLAAAAMVDQRGLDMQTDSGLAALANMGVKLSMIDQAVERQAKKAAVAAAVTTTGWSTDSSGNTTATINGVTFAAPNWAGMNFGDGVGGTTTSIGGQQYSGSSPAGYTGTGASSGSSGGSASGGGGSSKGGSGGGAGGGSGSSGARGSRSGGKGSSGKSGGGRGASGKGGGKGSSGGRRGGKRQFGGIIDEPIIGIGLDTGRDWLLGEAGREFVVPEGDYIGGGINVLNINVGNITKEADYIKLKPLIQRWILEASSRRGTV